MHKKGGVITKRSFHPKHLSKTERCRSLLLATRLLFLVLFLVSSGMVAWQLAQAQREQSEFAQLSALLEAAETQEKIHQPPDSASQSDVQAQEQKMIPQYAQLYERNHDFAGWLNVPHTKIDYPVMLTPAEPEYYLHRGFDQTNSRSGTPFIGADGRLDSDCLIIYGHNMKNGTMFGELQHYQEQAFWEKNQTFTFDTLYERREYEVFAALKTRVLHTNEDGFRYYRAAGALTDEAYTELINWLLEHSIYDTGVSPVYGQQILILSTCSYHTDNGRFIVAARRIPVSDPAPSEPMETDQKIPSSSAS